MEDILSLDFLFFDSIGIGGIFKSKAHKTDVGCSVRFFGGL